MTKFKIGDEVEVVKLNDKEDYSSTKDCIGKIGKVIHIDKKGNPHHVCLAINGEELWFYFNELKPLSPTPITKDGLQDGDKVTLICNDEYIVYNGYLLNSVSCLDLDDYDKDLTCVYASQNVKQVTRNGEVVYKRENPQFFEITYLVNGVERVEKACEIGGLLNLLEVINNKKILKIEVK